MQEFLEFTVGKFTFKVPTDRKYSHEGLWVKDEGNRARVGISDYVQQRSGDIAFAEVRPAGTALAAGDELATLETIKVSTSFATPLAGRITQANPLVESAPEIINQDPYGEGWLCEIELTDGEGDRKNLLDAHAYFAKIKREAENEVRRDG